MRSQLSPTLLLDLRLQAGYTFAPFGVHIYLEFPLVNYNAQI